MSEIDSAALDKFAEDFFASEERMKRIQNLTNEELAEALLLHVWSDLEVLSLQSDLVESAIERLRNG